MIYLKHLNSFEKISIIIACIIKKYHYWRADTSLYKIFYCYQQKKKRFKLVFFVLKSQLNMHIIRDIKKLLVLWRITQLYSWAWITYLLKPNTNLFIQAHHSFNINKLKYIAFTSRENWFLICKINKNYWVK